jgi:hemoglobin/transferrin/lactoferrin receptor protein
MIRTYLIIAALLCIFAVGLSAQTIKVVDKTHLKPIENVLISSDNFSKLTDRKGEANLKGFSQNDTLVFQHPFFKRKIKSYDDLKSSDFKVVLDESVVNLEEVTVSANKREQKLKEVPRNIAVIGAREISFDNPQTSADLLSATDEVYVQKSQLGGGSPMLRGFATSSVLLVVDGVRMNNAIFRSGNLQNVISLDANSIRKAEVIFGPGSVIYGSDAIGGVMDFHTLSPTLSQNGETNFHSYAATRYSSANNEQMGHIDLNIGMENWGFLTTFTYSDYGNLEMGSHDNPGYQREYYADRRNGRDVMVENDEPDVQKFSKYDQINFMQKVQYAPNSRFDLNYAFHYSKTSEVPRYDRLIQYSGDSLKYSEWYYGPQKWLMNSLTLNYSEPNLFFDRFKAILAYQNYQESRHDRDFGETSIRERYEEVDAYSFNLDLDKTLTNNSSLFYGFEAVYNKVHSNARQRNIVTGSKVDAPSRYPDNSDYSSFALYGNYKNNLTNKVTFQAGMRYSHIFIHAPFDTTFYKFPFTEIDINTGAINGSLGLVYRPKESWQFNMNASTGFRAPNIDDVGKVFDSEPGKVIVPNSNLEPEYAYNFDLGLIKTFNQKAQLELTGFYTYLDNAMVRRNFTFNGRDSIVYDGRLSQVQALVNETYAFVYGFQFSFDADITSNFMFQTDLSYQTGEDEEGNAIRHAAPLFGSTHLIYQARKFKADLYADYNGEISYENLALSERSKTHMYASNKNGNPYSPAWWTLNIKGSYQITEYIQINVGVENILDKRYRPYSSGIAAPGRNFIIGLKGGI